jgi:hypothetical protein
MVDEDSLTHDASFQDSQQGGPKKSKREVLANLERPGWVVLRVADLLREVRSKYVV